MILIPVFYQSKPGVMWAQLDDIDAGQMLHRWRPQRSSTGQSYAVRGVGNGRRGMKTLYLHREIMKPADDYEVDHRNGDTLDCRRGNLRIAAHQQNASNVRLPRHNTSGFKGVSLTANGNKWRAYIKKNQRQLFLGAFATAEEAARAYDRAAVDLFGEFARLNFPRAA